MPRVSGSRWKRPARDWRRETAVLRRLAATYPMLDRRKMLNETSELVTQHVIARREAAEVIDELEAVFARCYEEYRAEREG